MFNLGFAVNLRVTILPIAPVRDYVHIGVVLGCGELREGDGYGALPVHDPNLNCMLTMLGLGKADHVNLCSRTKWLYASLSLISGNEREAEVGLQIAIPDCFLFCTRMGIAQYGFNDTFLPLRIVSSDLCATSGHC